MKRDFFREYSIRPEDTLYFMPADPVGKRKSTIIHTVSGETIVPYQVKTVLKKYQMLSSINQHFVGQVVFDATRKKMLYPLPIRPNIVLIPVKTRLKNAKRGTYGYMNLPHIQKIGPSGVLESRSRILFQNQTSLLSSQNTRSLEQNFLCAKYLQNHYFAKCAEAGISYDIIGSLMTTFPEWEQE
ncbi:hypothetical protein J0B03_04310 [Alkalibacter rhizosphaerae]|uniref:ComK protein n=1 Tax=Alkalibacter rhizosphaerae TaxID=2815577 RepID=A0A975AIB4_9FIRM|nr:hypothetical protein [Alkalibacter rhizosphaerae]QSX09292.1 hypothetical protein J0B03_04310 [Alkalibacter rhizosphaerae]